VVAASNAGSSLHDRSLLGDVPAGTPVSRARVLPLHRVQWKLDGLLRRLGLPRSLARAALWPDEFVGWLPAAIVQSLRMVRRYRPDVLYTTSLPMTAHLAGLAVHRLTGLPWVADFRDSFTLNPLEGAARSVGLAGRASRELEEAVARSATCITFADETMDVCGLDRSDPRRIVIPNGVDEDDLRPVAPRPDGISDRFRLAYVGSLYGRHDAAEALAGIRMAIASGAVDPTRFELRIVGHASLESEAALHDLPVTRTGYLSHAQALEEMAGATALLYSRPAGDLVASGKIFEYLCSGRPILCVADPSSLAYRLVAEFGAGSCTDVRDRHAISSALVRLVQAWRGGRPREVDPGIRNRVLNRFSRRRLAAALADALAAAVS
jgi:glycosyltransferase involved in cell wall biosynthesis